MSNILITGSNGQIGSELVPILEQKNGQSNTFTLDLDGQVDQQHLVADVTNFAQIESIIKTHNIKEIYHLAAILSANGEREPDKAWDVNMAGLKNILDCAHAYHCKVFWPSSIAAFGPNTPKIAPQHTIMEPTTMYGLTKKAGEDICHYYFLKYGVDVRSVRFPGILSYKTPPGGGTSDYAVAVFYDAVRTGKNISFVDDQTTIPLMYINDALKAIVDIMSAPSESIKIRTSYNISALSSNFAQIITEIQKHTPLQVEHQVDFRQAIANSWPDQLLDDEARADWQWQPDYGLSKTVIAMLEGVRSLHV